MADRKQPTPRPANQVKPAPPPAPPRPVRSRHKWVKVRLHVYICRQCGCGSVNEQDANGGWFTTYHRPDGTSEVAKHVPACEPGPFTHRYLARYESAIACHSPARAATTTIENGANA